MYDHDRAGGMHKKAVIFVDGSNLFMGMRSVGRFIKPGEVRDLLVPFINGNVHPFVPMHYFVSVDRNSRRKEAFINEISCQGMVVHDYDLRYYPDTRSCKECRVRCSNCGRDLRVRPHKEKMLDVALASNIIEVSFRIPPDHADTFVIVSGDKDFIPVYRSLRERGKEILVAGFRDSDPIRNRLAYEVDMEVDGIINLNDIHGLPPFRGSRS